LRFLLQNSYYGIIHLQKLNQPLNIFSFVINILRILYYKEFIIILSLGFIIMGLFIMFWILITIPRFDRKEKRDLEIMKQ